jgi:hypothetical protein
MIMDFFKAFKPTIDFMGGLIMYSRLISIIVFFSLFSCGLKIGEPVPQAETVDLKNTKCLNQSISSIKMFFEGNASDNEVSEAFQCISQVLLAFKDNINGADRDFFEPQELAYFIETNFLKGEYTFSPSFLTEIMNLKAVLIGGSSKVIYKKDIEQLSALIERLRPEIIILNPEMKIISGNWLFSDVSDEVKEKKFTQAKRKAAHFFEVLSFEFARTGNKYEANSIINLIKQIALFSKSKSTTVDQIEKARPFLIGFKKNLVGQGTLIASRDWNKITKSLSEFLFQFLRIKYFLEPLSEAEEEKRWNVYEKISQDIFELMATLLDAQKNPVLSNVQVYELISAALPIFSDQVIDEELIQGISEIKNALIGDRVLNKDNWAPVELLLIKDKLPVLFSEIRKILNLIKDLDAQIKSGRQFYPEFNRIESDYNKSISVLMSTFDGDYSLISLRSFVESLRRNKLVDDTKWPKNLEPLFATAMSAKYVLTGTKVSVLKNSEFRHVVSIAAAGYFHFLEFKHYIQPYSKTEKNFYVGLDYILPKIKLTTQKALNFKPKHLISTDEVSDLFNVLLTEKLIELEISEAGFRSVLNMLWSNILLEPGRRLSGAQGQGFDSEALQQLTSETEIFIQSGYDLFDVFQNNTSLQQKTILDRIRKLINQSTTKPRQVLTLNELIRLVNSPVPMLFDQNSFLKILDKDLSYHLTDLYQAQMSRTISRIFIRSFAMDRNRIEKLSGVTLPETESFFNSVKTIIVDLGLIKPDDTEFISSRFREADLFAGHANGDDFVNLEELSDLVMHILSGLKRADILQTGILNSCLSGYSGPITDQTAVDENCVLQHYFNTSSGFESLPQFMEMKKTYSIEQNKKYYLSLLKAGGHIQNDRGSIFIQDANLFPHIAQYVEILFSRYDINRDGLLVKEEALAAFPVFKSTIKTVLKTIPSSGIIPDSQLPGVFIYLLKYGRPPKGLGETLKFLGFIKDENKWVIQSTRIDLGVIFNFLGETLATP